MPGSDAPALHTDKQAPGAGAVFEAQQGTVPERDRRGELAFRAVSYTPWPVEEGAEGERLRIPQGTVGQLQPRTFVFSRVLPQPSQLVMVTLERPLGIIFEEDVRRKRAVVVGFTPGDGWPRMLCCCCSAGATHTGRA